MELKVWRLNMKVVAIYLPQFHRVPENEAWWGKDFTDWVSTRNGSPLFEGHYQPHVPLNNNYYNLLDREVMEWQAKLMHDYQVDGLCFYHYWFKDGKQMLKEPAENLLKWKDINMPFCFCWANMSWARSWAKMRNADFWVNEDKEPMTKDGKALLIEQTYGNKQDWIKHFEYLLPFFKDERYIKVDEKPIIWIYRTDLMNCLAEMVACWDKLAKQNGLQGIYVIGSYYQTKYADVLDAAVIYEPGEIFTKVKYKRENESKVKIYDYEDYWNVSIKRDYSDIKTYYTGLVNYDSSPRQGENAEIVSGTPQQFGKWLKRLLKKSEQKGNEIVFLNAWNEWGEGNHLEPDEKYGYQYLEMIVKAKQTYNEVNEDEIRISAYSNEQLIELEQYQNVNNKLQTNMSVLEKWLKLKQKGCSLEDYPIFKKVSHIAIYGYGVLGKLLQSEFEKSDIIIDFFIDQNPIYTGGKIKVISLSDSMPDVDMIIIALPNYYDEILELLNAHNTKNYVLIDDIINELERNYIE